MKKLFTAIACLLFSFSSTYAQETSQILIQRTDKLYAFEKVYDVPGKSKDEIFETLKSWVVKNIKSQSNTNFFDEKNKNNIATTPSFPCHFNSWIDFKLNIDIKDGKYRLSATSFIWHDQQGIARSLGDFTGVTMSYTGMALTKKNKVKIVGDADEGLTRIINSIQNSFTKGSDW